jgi:hypothetical protein
MGWLIAQQADDKWHLQQNRHRYNRQPAPPRCPGQLATQHREATQPATLAQHLARLPAQGALRKKAPEMHF